MDGSGFLYMMVMAAISLQNLYTIAMSRISLSGVRVRVLLNTPTCSFVYKMMMPKHLSE
jgi:hypothetical protein